MSKYTTQVRWIVEAATPNFQGTITQRIKAAAPLIFNFDFPIWTEEYRLELETKFLRHYYMSEIGMETVALWKLFLENELNEIMPYYNHLYLTTIKDFDWLTDTDITETLERTEGRQENSSYQSTEENDTDTTDDTTSDSSVIGTSKATTTGNPSSHTMHNDFPQAPIGQSDYATYEDYRQDVISENNSSDTTDTTNASVKNIRTTNQDVEFYSSNNIKENKDSSHTIIRKGNSGSRSFTELLTMYRDSLINIDKMIISDLADLFMTVY